MNKKNVMYGLLALLGLYFVTKKSGSSTDTPTEDKGTPDLGNGSTPTPTPSGPQASTPLVEVQQASTPVELRTNLAAEQSWNAGPSGTLNYSAKVRDTTAPQGTKTPYVGTPPQNTEDINRFKGKVYSM